MLYTKVDLDTGFKLRQEFRGDFAALRESFKLGEISFAEFNVAARQATFDFSRGYSNAHECADLFLANDCESCDEQRGFSISLWHMNGLDLEYAETHYWNYKYIY